MTLGVMTSTMRLYRLDTTGVVSTLAYLAVSVLMGIGAGGGEILLLGMQRELMPKLGLWIKGKK